MSYPYPDPIDLASSFVKETGAALRAGDFDRFARHWHVPHTVIGYEGQRVIRSREEFETLFNDIRYGIVGDGVARIERYVEEAERVDPRTIRFTHVSRLHKHNGETSPAFPCLSTVTHYGGAWKIAEAQYALLPELAARNQLGGRKQTMAASDAEATLRRVLDLLTRAFLTGDADTCAKHTALPFVMQSRSCMQVLRTEAELRQDLALYQMELRERGVTDILRTPRRIDHSGDDSISAIFATYVLKGQELLMPSYDSKFTIERGADGLWRQTSMTLAHGHFNSSLHLPGLADNARLFDVEFLTSAPDDGAQKPTGDPHG